jgi:hypothetical protein
MSRYTATQNIWLLLYITPKVPAVRWTDFEGVAWEVRVIIRQELDALRTSN